MRVIEKIQNHPGDFSVLENNYLMNTSAFMIKFDTNLFAFEFKTF